MHQTLKSASELLRDLGVAMRELRVSRNLTQKQTAAKARVALRALANLERGGGSSLETWLRTLNALGRADFLDLLSSQSEVSPLAMLRVKSAQRQRVRHRRTEP